LAVGFGVVAAASLVLLGAGLGKRRLAKQAAEYQALFQRKKVYTFDELAAEVGRPPKQIKKEIRKIRAKGLLPEVRTDADETCVMQGEETYRQYLAAEKTRLRRETEAEERQRRLKDPATAGIERFRSEGADALRKIQAANDALPGEEISQKLSLLESTAARIFSHVEQHPEKLPDTRKFMSYYMPTTLKLVEKYHQYEDMDFQPDNVKRAKSDIVHSLDTVNLAFTNLLESLFAHDTLDVSTDIDVLEKMLEQEGLTGSQFEIDPPGNP
jgi:predicted transcriptional regulator